LLIFFYMSKYFAILFIFSLTVFSCKNNSAPKPEPTQESGKINEETIVYNDSIETETLDQWLKLNTGEKEIIQKMGKPTKKGKIEFWDATGTYVQSWDYVSKGITLDMESESKNALKTLRSITIIAPCEFQTSRAISVGSEATQIYERYKGLIDLDFSDDATIVVGSIYNGTIFEITDNKVSKIFIGAAAE